MTNYYIWFKIWTYYLHWSKLYCVCICVFDYFIAAYKPRVINQLKHQP